MRILLQTLIFSLAAGPAFAHVGHIGELAGHSHWIGVAALAAAAAVAALAARAKPKSERGENANSESADSETPDSTPQEA